MEKRETVCAACHGMDVWHTKHMLIRWLLGLLILIIVFKVGMRIGEFKRDVEYGTFGDMRAHHQMLHNSGSYGYYYQPPGMMPTPFQTQLLPPISSPSAGPKTTKTP